MVARSAVLLERGFVLFVEHDQAEVRRGGENGACGADDHPQIAVGDLLPIAMPLDVGLVAVHHRHAAEARTKSLLGLRRQADLGNQHDRLPAVTQDFVDGLNVDFGLAATGDPMQQHGRGGARFERGQNRCRAPGAGRS